MPISDRLKAVKGSITSGILKALIVLCFIFSASCIPEGYRDVDAQELKGLLDRGTVLIVDTRWEREYQAGHIPTAISVQPYQIEDIEKLLPEDKEKTIVFYCRGYG